MLYLALYVFAVFPWEIIAAATRRKPRVVWGLIAARAVAATLVFLFGRYQ